MADEPVPPTLPQLEYLAALGWRGPQPRSIRDASALIDQLKERRDAERRAQQGAGGIGCLGGFVLGFITGVMLTIGGIIALVVLAAAGR